MRDALHDIERPAQLSIPSFDPDAKQATGAGRLRTGCVQMITRRGLRATIALPPAATEELQARPCLVHLVRAANGLAPLRAFAAALRRHPPGTDCRLVLAMKGFRSPDEARPYVRELIDLEPEALFFADRGLDLGTYLAVAGRLRQSRYCFVNSFSFPLADGWLGKLDAALARAGVGMTGATGSWESNRSWTAYALGLPSAYRGLLPPASVVRRQLHKLMSAQASGGGDSTAEVLRARARAALLLSEQQRFPAYALRTNAFMISHATLRSLRLHEIKGHADTLTLESGRKSLTRRVHRIGLRTLIVDRAGCTYDHEHWDRSLAFYQSEQEGLLVGDNRTLLYEQGDSAMRQLLSTLAWGPRACPGEPA